MTQVVVTDGYRPEFLTRLEQVPGISWAYHPSPTGEAFLNDVCRAQVLLLRSRPQITAAWLVHAPALRCIIRGGVGLEHIDLGTCQARGIAVQSTPGVNAAAVGQMAAAMALALSRNLLKADAQVRRGLWPRHENRGTELTGLTAGIIGYGHTGRATARLLRALGMHVLAYDPYITWPELTPARQASMPEIWEHAHLLSLHVPLTKETDGLVHEGYIQAFQHPLWLLNLSRGEVVNLPHALAALNSGLLRGLALDVFPHEPVHTGPPDWQTTYQALMAHPGTILTPHIAGWSLQAEEALEEAALAHLHNYLHTRA